MEQTDSTLPGDTVLSRAGPRSLSGPSARLCQIVARLHPQQGFSADPEGFFKTQRHHCRQAGVAVQQYAHVLAAHAEMFRHLGHRHGRSIEVGPLQPGAGVDEQRRVHLERHQW
jgi:hypothetical protein